MVLATRWRDVSTGLHVDYDQRPDVFRYEKLFQFGGLEVLIEMLYFVFSVAVPANKHLYWQGNRTLCQCACSFRQNR